MTVTLFKLRLNMLTPLPAMVNTVLSVALLTLLIILNVGLPQQDTCTLKMALRAAL
jgi:hypothetical protein